MKQAMLWIFRWGLPVAIGIALAFYFRPAAAGGLIPEGVVSFIDEFGRACTIYEGSLDCDFDPCSLCEVQYVSTPNPTATPVIPTKTPVIPTPRPTPEEKESCNRGLGNGAESCDPGNSGKKPGSAGEENE